MKDITNYLEQVQVDEMIAAAQQCSTRDSLILKVLWQSGIRVDELLHIRPQDIEYHNQRINIVKAKGGKQRRVPLKPETFTELQTYIQEQGIVTGSPLFQNKEGQAYSQRYIRKIVKKYGSLIHKDVHPHTFRHSFAINMVKGGCDLRRLQLCLGHSNINTTAIYLQFEDRDLQEIYDKVSF